MFALLCYLLLLSAGANAFVKDIHSAELKRELRKSGFHMNIWNNVSPAQDVKLFYLDQKSEEQFLGEIAADQIYGVNSFHDHMFVIRSNDKFNRHLETIVAQRDTDCVLNSDNCDESTNIHPIVPIGKKRFMELYQKENGIPWKSVYPKHAPAHFVYPLKQVGESHEHRSSFPHFVATSSTKSLPSMDQPAPAPEHGQTFELVTASTSPHILSIDDFLSPDEVDHILKFLSERNQLADSTVGVDAQMTSSRKSKTMWIDFNATPVLENIARRIFEMIGIEYDHKTAWKIVEKFQLLHYDVGGRYNSHHDHFGIDKKSLDSVKGKNRFATFFLYLNDVEEGGETAFPHRNVDGSNGRSRSDACTNEESFKVRPSKGKAVFWYNMLPDGNWDTQALHTACPVIKGEKYGMNVWIWDPFRLD